MENVPQNMVTQIDPSATAPVYPSPQMYTQQAPTYPSPEMMAMFGGASVPPPSFFQPFTYAPQFTGTAPAPGVAPPPETMPSPTDTGPRPPVGVGVPPPASAPISATMYPAGTYGQMTSQPTPDAFPVPSSLPYPNLGGNPFYAGIPQAPAPVYPDPSMVDRGEIDYGIAGRGNFGDNSSVGFVGAIDHSTTAGRLVNDYGYSQAEATAMPAYQRAQIIGVPVYSPFGGVGPDGTRYTESIMFYPDGTVARGGVMNNTIVYTPPQ